MAGLANDGFPRHGPELGATAIVAVGPPAIGPERARSLDELRSVVELALIHGRSGELSVHDYLAELLLRRSPRIASRIAARVYGPLSRELSHTLDLLVEHSFERSAPHGCLSWRGAIWVGASSHCGPG